MVRFAKARDCILPQLGAAEPDYSKYRVSMRALSLARAHADVLLDQAFHLTGLFFPFGGLGLDGRASGSGGGRSQIQQTCLEEKLWDDSVDGVSHRLFIGRNQKLL